MNLCMLFAATVGDDDVKLFKYHARLDGKRPWTGQIVEIDFGGQTNFDWNQKNFDHGWHIGWEAAKKAWEEYKRGRYRADPNAVIEAWKHWPFRASEGP